jgi:hypothetical protein
MPGTIKTHHVENKGVIGQMGHNPPIYEIETFKDIKGYEGSYQI